MLISVHAPHRAGGLSISGVDVIVYSWLKGLAGTSIWRISVDNIHAFFVFFIYPDFLDFRNSVAV